MPLRVGSTLSDGSCCKTPGPATRSSPTCWKQNLCPVTADPVGFVHPVPATAWETKICGDPEVGVPAPCTPSNSCQVTQGAGLPPATVVPPIRAGRSALRLVLMFSDGTVARPSPSCCHWPPFCPVLGTNRLAKISFEPRDGVASAQPTHGTVRFAPVKSIEGE